MNQLSVLKGHKDSVYCLIVWNNHLYSGSWDNTIRKWNENGNCIATLRGHTHVAYCLTVWNNCLYSGSLDCTIRKWGDFYYSDYNGLLDEKKKEIFIWELVGRRLGLKKDIRLIIMRHLL